MKDYGKLIVLDIDRQRLMNLENSKYLINKT